MFAHMTDAQSLNRGRGCEQHSLAISSSEHCLISDGPQTPVLPGETLGTVSYWDKGLEGRNWACSGILRISSGDRHTLMLQPKFPSLFSSHIASQ